MVATTIHLMRHGEVHNPDGVLYGRLPGYRLSERGRAMADMVAAHLAGVPCARATSSPSSPPRCSARRRPPDPSPPRSASTIGTDERLIEAGNHFEGLTFGVGDGSLRHPSTGRTCATRSGRPGASRTRSRSTACSPPSTSARELARGHEAVLVSHQLPVWVTRLALENRHLWHDPRKRQCSVASLTSLRYEGDTLVGIGYSEPAGLAAARRRRPVAGA